MRKAGVAKTKHSKELRKILVALIAEENAAEGIRRLARGEGVEVTIGQGN